MRKLLGLAAILFFIAPTVHAQNGFRFTSQVSQQGTVASVSNVVVLPANPIISFCNAPAIGVPCINKATTYTSATLATPCSTSTQIVLDGTTTCVANPDSQNNWGVWLASGQYAYTITLPGGANLGPFYVTAGGAGGGAGNPASPGQAFQLANAGVTGFATTGCGGQTIGIDSLTSPTVLNDPCSFAVGGPRPYMDVTSTVFAGGAKGDSSTDDTAAIQAAITAACATTTKFNGFAMHPAVVFPAGIYRVAQPQGSSAAIFTIPCTFLEFRGFPGGSASQFANPTSWIVVTAGASPGSGPVFLIQGPTAHNIRFADIAITGYNEAYWLRSTADITFDNAPMAITGQTGLTDNAALKITNTEEVWRVNRSNASAVHANGSEDPTTPTVLYTNETPLGAEAALNGYIHTSDVVDTGGGEQCIQRVNAGGELVQHFTFKNTFLEDSNTGFLTCTNTSGVPMSIAAMEFESVGVEPFTVTTAVLTLNDSQGQMSGITMNDVAEGSLAIQVLAGHLYGYSVNGCNTLCSNQVVDANGNSIGTGQTYERYGAIDHFSDNSFLVAQPTAGLANQFSASPTISDRWCPSGRMFCSLGADPSFGFLFGSGDSNGFNVGLNQTAIETLDVQFASLLPPTAFSGTATTGGTLAAGTYFAQIWSASNLNCTNAPISAPTYSTGVVVGGSNNAINFAWTVPITTPSAPAGYCLEIQNSAISPGSEIFAYLFASGAGTTTFSYTGQAQNGTGIAPANAMVSRHRFTQNGLNLAGAVNAYTDTGAANAYVVTTAPTFSTLPLFFQVCFLTVNGNTGPSALNVDGIGATAIKKQGGTTALASGDIAPNSVACVQYDGTNFELQSSVANAPVAGVSSFSGDGTLLNNIASTGPVTATLATAGAHTVFGNRTGSTAAPGYGILVSADIPNNAANTSGTASLATAADHTPTLCGTGNAPTGVDASFNAVACASIASGLTVKTNTVNNTDQTVLDFTNPASFNGLTFAFSNPTGGKETFAVGGTLNNAGLTNAGTTVNGQSCVLGATCAVPILINGSPLSSLNGVNAVTSTVNTMGITITPNNLAGGIIEKQEATGTVNTTSGGTGASAPTAHQVPVAEGASAFNFASPNTTGFCFLSNGLSADPSFQNCPGLVNPMTTLGDIIYGGSSPAGTPTRLSGPTGVNGVTQYLTSTPSSSLATAPAFSPAGLTPRVNTATTDTIVATDRAGIVTESNASAVAVSIAQAGTTGFASNFVFRLQNLGAGAVTLTPTTSTIDGNTTLVLNQGDSCTVTSDNTNYFSSCYSTLLTAGTNITFTRTAHGLTIASASGGGTVTTSGSPASPNPACFSSATAITNCTTTGSGSVVLGTGPTITLTNASALPCSALPAFTGDMTTSAGSCATTNSGINGAAVTGTNGDIVLFGASNHLTDGGTAVPNGFTATTQSAGDTTAKVATDSFVSTAVANGIAAVNPAVAVLAASTANLTGTYVQVGGGIGDTFTVTATGAFSLDGIAINTIGQRVLLKNQTTASQNGVYTATVVGTTGVSPVFTRALDYDTPSDVNNSGIIPVQSGTANIGTTWLLTSQVTSIGSSGSSLTYAQYSVNSANVVQAVSPGAGVAHFAGSTQTVTSSAVTPGDATGNTTGSGNFVLVTSPTLVTPALGAATATSLLASGIVDGKAPVTVTTGTTATLGAATYQSGYTFNQEATAGTGVTYTLPATATGLQYCVANSIVSGTGAPNTGVLTVYPPASSYIIYKGVRNTIGGGGTHGIASGGAAADAACFVAIDATDWVVYAQSGTWTEN